jgi:MFS family permease
MWPQRISLGADFEGYRNASCRVSTAGEARTHAKALNLGIDPDEMMSLRSIGRALTHRNYRLFFLGQSVSLIGTWMQQVAMIWLVFSLSNSPFLLGLVGFVGQAPFFVAAPLAGVFIDRWNCHRAIIATQALAMAQAVAMTALVVAGLITVWQVVVLALVLGIINAFDMPLRQAFVVEIIDDRADLGNAIALNSSMFNGARLVGPAIAGFLMEHWGGAMCFGVNAASYLGVLAALMAMRVKPRPVAAAHGHVLHGLKEGFGYALGSMPIRTILGLLSLLSLAGMPLLVLMPVLAKEVFHGDARTFAILTAASGLGALAGAIYLAARKSVIGLIRLMTIMTAAMGLATIGVACSQIFPLTLALLALAGFSAIAGLAACNTVLQTIVDEDKRGRVMSLYSAAFMGAAPIGSLLAGGLASVLGAPWTIAIFGVVSILGAVAFWSQLPVMRRHLRPIYVKAGILPEAPPALSVALPPELGPH